MRTVDYKKSHKELYSATGKVKLVEDAKGTFLAVDGQGAPGGERYQEAINLLFGVAYTAKFALKGQGVVDFKVPPLENLWPPGDYHKRAPSQWRWTLMLRVPEELDAMTLRETRQALRARKGLDASAVKRRSISLGRCLQVMHVGPYDRIGETYQALAAHAATSRLVPRGGSCEAYLSDPRRVAPSKLRTIVRLQVKRAGR